MTVSHLSVDELAALVTEPIGSGDPLQQPRAVAVVDLDDTARSSLPPLPSWLATVVVGLAAVDPPHEHPLAGACDVVLAPGDGLLAALTNGVEQHPIAAASLAGLLRISEGRSTADGLLAESAVYSALQAGPEFDSWRAARPRRDRGPEGEPVRLERNGSVLTITLDRPHVRNALNTAMRDALVEAFGLVAADDTITAAHLRGAGPAFCAGGDLDEFGTFPDPATAHLVRLQQSVGRSIDTVSDRVTAMLHGACAGSGIELPAFAHRVVAHPSTTISLPELGLGLIPGAGGTVSLPRRIGRHRTARLALTGEVIDAATALRWGLVDAIEDVTPPG